MKYENRKEKTTSEFVEVNGIGTVATTDGYRDVFIYGYFTKWDRWTFIVHQDIIDTECVTISEASTGFILQDECYHNVEDALHFGIPFIDEKKFYFATFVTNALVKTQTNLFRRNISPQTIAIDTVLWL